MDASLASLHYKLTSSMKVDTPRGKAEKHAHLATDEHLMEATKDSNAEDKSSYGAESEALWKDLAQQRPGFGPHKASYHYNIEFGFWAKIPWYDPDRSERERYKTLAKPYKAKYVRSIAAWNARVPLSPSMEGWEGSDLLFFTDNPDDEEF